MAVNEGRDTLASCIRCGHSYPLADWLELEKVTTLSQADVRAHVVGWGDDASIDVRTCRGCGRRLARVVRAHPVT